MWRAARNRREPIAARGTETAMRGKPEETLSLPWSRRVYVGGYRLIERIRLRLPYLGRLYRQIEELRHRLAAIEPNPSVYPAPASHDAAIVEEFRAFLRLLQPHDAARINKARIGSIGDGGYVMLDDFGPVRHAVSLGIGREVSWDLDIADRGIRVLQFDHSVAGSPRRHAHFAFHQKRVVAAPAGVEDISLSQILADDRLAGDREIIVKMDIDGAEWEVLAGADSAVLARIRQIVVEFHDLRSFPDRGFRRTALRALHNLASTHACVHVHGNNCEPFVVIGGIPFPNTFEATFVRRADCALTPSVASFPTPLDQPNNPKRADHFLGRWDY
jgi:hypothetical protein